MSLLPYKESVTAEDEISTTSEVFTFGSAALTKTFTIFERGTYLVGVGYSWGADRVQDQHRTRVMIGGVEKPGLSINQFTGGAMTSGVNPGTERVVLHDFEVGDFLVEMEFSTSKVGQPVFLFERGLFISRYD